MHPRSNGTLRNQSNLFGHFCLFLNFVVRKVKGYFLRSNNAGCCVYPCASSSFRMQICEMAFLKSKNEKKQKKNPELSTFTTFSTVFGHRIPEKSRKRAEIAFLSIVDSWRKRNHFSHKKKKIENACSCFPHLMALRKIKK